MGALTIGIDIGQRVDPTAIAVVEQEWRNRGQRRETHFLVRHLERLPLGTGYPQVAERALAVAASAQQMTRTVPVLFLDATGVGTPVFDALVTAARVRDIRVYIYPCYFNYGDRRLIERSPHGGGLLDSIKIGKAWLVSRLQVLLQDRRLHLPETAEARVLAKELLDYEIRVDQDANDKYGAFKVGTHDDLVTALGLACQDDARVAPPSTIRVIGLHA